MRGIGLAGRGMGSYQIVIHMAVLFSSIDGWFEWLMQGKGEESR
jgi:hypothetical protein